MGKIDRAKRTGLPSAPPMRTGGEKEKQRPHFSQNTPLQSQPQDPLSDQVTQYLARVLSHDALEYLNRLAEESVQNEENPLVRPARRGLRTELAERLAAELEEVSGSAGASTIIDLQCFRGPTVAPRPRRDQEPEEWMRDMEAVLGDLATVIRRLGYTVKKTR